VEGKSLRAAILKAFAEALQSTNLRLQQIPDNSFFNHGSPEAFNAFGHRTFVLFHFSKSSLQKYSLWCETRPQNLRLFPTYSDSALKICFG
jgi:hypothetical protein